MEQVLSAPNRLQAQAAKMQLLLPCPPPPPWTRAGPGGGGERGRSKTNRLKAPLPSHQQGQQLQHLVLLIALDGAFIGSCKLEWVCMREAQGCQISCKYVAFASRKVVESLVCTCMQSRLAALHE